MGNSLRHHVVILKFIFALILWYTFPIVGGTAALLLMIWWFHTWRLN